MKSQILIKNLKVLAVAVTTAFFIAACGGSGSSSNAGGGSGLTAGTAAISGNVSSGLAFQAHTTEGTSTLAKVMHSLVTEARASGVVGVTVQLLVAGGVVDSQVTDADGNFSFINLAPGTYNLQLVMDGQSVGASPPVQLDADTTTKLELSLSGGISELEIRASNTSISGSVDDNSDDLSSDDDESSDDQLSSVDDDSESDDDSDDDLNSEDDESDDDSDIISG